jgi:amino acid adenylation domain-containing protein
MPLPLSKNVGPSSIAQLPLLNESEFQQIVFDWNQTSGPFPSEQLIHEAFEERARHAPEGVAVVAGQREFTYREINERANQLARLLTSKGIGPGAFVGVCLQRSEAPIIAVLAVVKAGAAYAPLDPAYPRDRLAFMIEDAKAPLVITQSSLLERLPEAATRYLCVDALTGELQTQSSENPPRVATPDDRAYLIYTSGSTGRPKGVLLRHRPVVNVLDWANSTFAVGPSDRLLFVTSLSFDLSVYDIFGALGAGASIRVAAENELRDPAQLLRVLKTEPITIWDSAPAALSQLVPFFGKELADGNCSSSSAGCLSGNHLRLTLLSGDWVPVTLPDQVRRAFPCAQVVSLGGATEAAIWSNWYPVGAVGLDWPSIPYGKPIRNARYHILDECLQPVPVGAPGELHIGGDVLADGYLNRDELTAERFIRDPFSTDASARLYKTGDRARYFPDGNIEFLGRLDNQVKIRGFRVEAGEIETLIGQVEGVQDVVVKPHKDSSGDNYLTAYIVAKSSRRPDAVAITQYLQSKLPEYMTPARIIFLAALPLTPNGKVDRAALLPPEAPAAATEYEPPADAVEAGIAQVWGEVLGQEPVGRHDSFFELGGHSLRAAMAVARLQEKFDVDLRLPILFEKPTAAALADEIRRLGPDVKRALIPRRPAITRAPASLIQQRFWFLDQNIADRTVYNVADAIRLRGPLHPGALRKAWQALVDRQGSLRTTFESIDGWPEQVEQPLTVVDLPFVDLSARADAEAEARRLLAQDARLPFDVVNGPLWRARILKIGPDEHLLTWTIHHLIIDESSRAVLLRDLWTAYESALNGKAATLPELPARYLDYSLWQRNLLTPAAIDYWKQRLHGAPPPLAPPHPKPRPATRSHQGATIAFSVPPAVAKAMARISRGAGATPYMTWLAAFQTLLFRYTGQADVCVGSPVTTRPAAAADIVGCFINTLVMRTDLGGNPSFRELLGRARATLLGAMQHSDVPFEKLVEEIKPERTPGGHPLFQSLFVYQAEDLQGAAAGGLTWRHDHLERVGAKFDFTLTIEEQEGRTRGYVEYASDLYDAGTAQRGVGHFLTLIEGIAARPDAALADLPLLPPFERESVLHAFNATAGDVPSDRCVQQLVEAQVERAAGAVAFEFGGRTLTYGELNRKANQLAHCLRSFGVGPDTLVGLCVERSLDMPVALLGILKAGGAYVPLDPDFPPERLSFYIADSKMPIIVAHHHLLDNLPVGGLRQVCLDQDADKIAAQPASNPRPIARPDNLIYVLYTSGSTGRPNGVAVEQRSLVNLLWSFKDRPGLTAADTILSLTTLSFDIHTVETWLPLIVGARAIIVPRQTALDGHRLIELLHGSNATVMQSTPATWRLLLTAGWKGKADLRAWAGGEALASELAQQLLQRTAELWNVYGPTETTVWSIIHPVSAQDERVLIGKPVLNTQVYVLDSASRQPLPIGSIGEIWIAGAGLARGYLGRPELTEARFVPNPFVAGARMYRTGDLGRYLPDGALECLGRVDHQVKVRGFRIELNEIERVLEEHAGLAQAVVVARTDDEFAATVHAYYRCQAGQAPTPADLRKFAQGRLPDYMIPATFTKLDVFSQTPNGKVDRQALPAPTVDAAARAVEHERALPATDAERALLAIWEEALGIHPIGVTDDFQELGGHSLLAAVLVSRIESRLGHRLPLEALLDRRTIRGLADVITRKLELSGGIMAPLQTGGAQVPLFLIAGVGGHVFAFHSFARRLGPDYPVFGMRAIGIDGAEPPLDRFEEIAARYVKEIVTACPEGPCIVGGYSVGGRIALEVALQLQALGRHVPRLVIIDMFAPGFPKPLALFRRIQVHLMHLWKLRLRDKWTFAWERLRHLVQRVHLEPFHDIMVKDLDVAPKQVLHDVGVALLRGNDRYMPLRKFKGKIVLVQSDVIEEWEDAVERVDLQGWAYWSTEPVEEHTLRAGHLEMFKEHVQPRMAEIIRGVIREASEEAELAETRQD